MQSCNVSNSTSDKDDKDKSFMKIYATTKNSYSHTLSEKISANKTTEI